jgi:hypothetical protein
VPAGTLYKVTAVVALLPVPNTVPPELMLVVPIALAFAPLTTAVKVMVAGAVKVLPVELAVKLIDCAHACVAALQQRKD